MDLSANSLGGTDTCDDTGAAVCGTLDDNSEQSGDLNDSQKFCKSQSGLISGITAIQDDILALSAPTQDCTVVHDIQILSTTVGDTISDTSTASSADVDTRWTSQKDSDSLEMDSEHLLQDQIAASADVELDRQPAREAGVEGPQAHENFDTKSPVQCKSDTQLVTQTAESSSLMNSTDSKDGRGSQVDGVDDKRILHQQARKALAAVRKAQPMAAEAAPDSTMSDSEEAQVANAIAEWSGLQKQLASSQSRHQEQQSSLQEKIFEREKEATELQSKYKETLGRLLREAVDPKTGKGIPVAKITALEQFLLLKEHAADTARFRVLYLRAKLHRAQKLQQSREVSLGLHLVDFEQLRVESAHLSAKIEARGRQLADAQKKSHAALNVLAHVKEKHHQEKRKCAELQTTLAKAQEQVQIDKERARSAAEQRLKRKTRQMKLQEEKLLQDPTLMGNFQELRLVREQWTSKVALLREQHAATMRAQ